MTPTGGIQGFNDPRGLIPYIRERAQTYGINPDVAVNVAQSEGLGSFKSSVPGENSYGAFQLYTGGGLGNDFQRATGLDPSDPKNEQAGIDFALKHASQHGWGAFHGAKNRYGYGPWEGITVGSGGDIGQANALPPPAATMPQFPTPPPAPQQQPQQPPPGGPQMAAGAPSVQPQAIQALLQQLATYRPQVNQMPLQNFMGQLPQTLLPANLKPFSF